MSKPHYGRIKNGVQIKIDPAHQSGLGYRIHGEFLDHPEFRGEVTTSEVIAFDPATGELETRNSRYKLVTHGVAQRYRNLPMVGDRVRFTNTGGYDGERPDALGVLGTQRLYTVKAVHIGGSTSHIILLETGDSREWNTVMFDIVERADDPVEEVAPYAMIGPSVVVETPTPYVLPPAMIAALVGERRYQIERWGANHDETTSVGDFVMYMEAYLHHLKLSMTANNPVNPDGMDIMRKIVSLGIACMERHGIVERA